RIAASNEAITITVIGGGSDDAGGKGGDVLAWSSHDDGETWQGPVRVNDVKDSAREGLHALASGPSGQLFCAWLDLREGGTKIVGSRSTDGGSTWSKNVLVYQSPDGHVCECCHPSAAFDSAGGVYVMW